MPIIKTCLRRMKASIADFSRAKSAAKPRTEKSPESPEYYIYEHLPNKVQLEVSTVCQLRCAGCSFQAGGNDDLGRGFLTVDNFKRFTEMNPFVKEIEISNYGEPFLNPNLARIMYEAKARNICLTCRNGSNFNTVSDEQMQAMVESGLRAITLSIDGASQEVYSKYRVGGDFDRVIENITKLQALKKRMGSELPKLRWQYVLMEHNELDIERAKKLAARLGIPITFKYNWDETYVPVNRQYVCEQTGLTELTRAEYFAAHNQPYFGWICKQVFLSPQINWDGRLLGCCNPSYASFDVNVFEVGLAEALRSPKYLLAKKCLLEAHPDEEVYSSCICFNCPTRRLRAATGIGLELP